MTIFDRDVATALSRIETTLQILAFHIERNGLSGDGKDELDRSVDAVRSAIRQVYAHDLGHYSVTIQTEPQTNSAKLNTAISTLPNPHCHRSPAEGDG